jgi:glucose-1-phosphate thymidylyltransferase
MKGIILAGGSGTRLHPITLGLSKQLLPVYDKPMIYYPLSTLMLAGIQDILIITTPQDKDNFIRLLGDGSSFGINLSYAVQPNPDGLAQAFIIGEKFIGNNNVCLILGDNIFIGTEEFKSKLNRAATNRRPGATVFGYQVEDPHRFGIIEFNKNAEIVGIKEKPVNPHSNWAVTGLYFYDNDVIDIAKTITPSNRGELEITSVNEAYLQSRLLNVEFLDEHLFWLDTGTYVSLSLASNLIKKEQEKTGKIISCPEEIAWGNGWLSDEALNAAGSKLNKCHYGKYLLSLPLERCVSL